jgi:hypothetical protein
MAAFNPWTILKVGQVIIGGVWLAMDILGLIRGEQKPDDGKTSS